MKANVKLIGIENPIVIANCETVESLYNKNDTNLKPENLENCHFTRDKYYIFKGNSILHVSGEKIEYVLFEK